MYFANMRLESTPESVRHFVESGILEEIHERILTMLSTRRRSMNVYRISIDQTSGIIEISLPYWVCIDSSNLFSITCRLPEGFSTFREKYMNQDIRNGIIECKYNTALMAATI